MHITLFLQHAYSKLQSIHSISLAVARATYALPSLARLCHLRGQLCGLHLAVLLGVGQDGAEGAAQELLLHVRRLPHQRRQRHGHLHLHPGEVLQR